MPWHLTFDIDITWHLIFDNLQLTFDIWHLTWLKVLTALALILMILAQSIFTNGFWGYLRNLKRLVPHSLSHNTDLRDASASKKDQKIWAVVTPLPNGQFQFKSTRTLLDPSSTGSTRSARSLSSSKQKNRNILCSPCVLSIWNWSRYIFDWCQLIILVSVKVSNHFKVNFFQSYQSALVFDCLFLALFSLLQYLFIPMSKCLLHLHLLLCLLLVSLLLMVVSRANFFWPVFIDAEDEELGRVVRLVDPVLDGCFAGATGAAAVSAAVAAAEPVVGGAHVA